MRRTWTTTSSVKTSMLAPATVPASLDHYDVGLQLRLQMISPLVGTPSGIPTSIDYRRKIVIIARLGEGLIFRRNPLDWQPVLIDSKTCLM